MIAVGAEKKSAFHKTVILRLNFAIDDNLNLGAFGGYKGNMPIIDAADSVKYLIGHRAKQHLGKMIRFIRFI